MKKKRILIVEDSSVAALEIERKLTKLGFEVVAVVSSGEESVVKVQEYKPDLVLMDIRLSGKMDGIEATKEIKKLNDFPVLYITALSDRDTIDRAKETTPYGFLLKPFDETDIVSSIEIALKRNEYDRALKENENRYRILFEDSPISLWEEDFTDVSESMGILTGTDADEISKVFSENPGRVRELAEKIKLLNVNKATLKLVQARDKDELLNQIGKTYTRQMLNTLKDAFISLSKGESSFEAYTVISTMTGENKHVYIKGFIAPGHRSLITRVLISMIDITDLKNTEEDLFKQWLLLNSINRLFLTTMMSRDEWEIIQTCISETCEITDSEFVFFSEQIAGTGLKTITLADFDLKLEERDAAYLAQISLEKIRDKLFGDRHTFIAYAPEEFPDYFKLLDGMHRITSFICTPLTYGERNIGMLGLANKKREYQFFDQQALESISVSFVEALNSKRNEKALINAMEELTALYRISSLISQNMDMQDLFSKILDTISNLKLFNLPKKGCIFVADGKALKLVSHMGHSEEFIACHKDLKIGECLCGKAAESGEIIIERNCTLRSGHKYCGDAEEHGHIIVPLNAANSVVGVLGLYLEKDFDELNERQLQVISSIGNQLGIAITNLKLFEETKRLSLHDPLTGLANRRQMEHAFGDNVARSKRYKRKFSILMVDIDFFKKYNDTEGHQAGDALLSIVAKILSEEVRDVDLVTRYGGEEFLIMLPEIDREDAIVVAERIRFSVQEKTRVTISIGVSTFSEDMGDESDLIKRADEALYRAKNNGRNRVEVDV